MARKLFEFRATRARSGGLAVGIEYVVWDNEAATVLADISTSSGGSSIVGSTVTTADIAGLGPSACRFYGPTDDQDTLWVTCPSDPTLGVQKVDAQVDARLDALEAGGGGVQLSGTNTWTGINTFDNGALFTSGHPWVDAAAFVEAGDAGNDALALQRAIDYAQTLVGSSTKVPMVVLTGDEYHWTTPITWKSAPIVALTTANNGCLIYWDGAAGATVIDKDNSAPGGLTFGLMQNLAFYAGVNEPAHWLDLTDGGAYVDAGFRLTDLQFGGSTSDAIWANGFINCHWRNLRFDQIGGGYAIRFTMGAGSGPNLGSFVLDQFTYDHTRASGYGHGVIHVDNSLANGSNLGVLTLRGGRIEVNTAWVGNQAVVCYKIPNTGANANALGVCLEDVAYQGTASMTSDCLLYQDTTSTSHFPSLVLKNVRTQDLSAVVGGTLSSSFPAIPVHSNYGLVSVVQGSGDDIITSQLRLLMSSFGGGAALAVRRGNESQDRFVLTEEGTLKWGGGSGATDILMKREAADILKLEDALWLTGTLFTDGYQELSRQGADPSAPAATRARLYQKDNGSGKAQLCVRFPTGAVQVIATEP